MADPYYGEIRAFAFDYAPQDWAFCAGQTMPVSQNQVLFAVIGNVYGGDGRTTFNLPNLQGRTVMGQGTGPGLSQRRVADSVGTRVVPLSLAQLPSHVHDVNVESDNATATDATGASWARAVGTGAKPAPVNLYSTSPVDKSLSPAAVSQVGGGLAHDNMQPYLTLNLCISLSGEFPVRP